MKIIKVQGTSKTGKTTTVTAIIRELVRRGYTVGSIKEIHFERFTLETEGSNTDLHKKAGANPVTAHSYTETDMMYGESLNIDRLLDRYTQDYVVIEGCCDANCPSIITGKTTADLEAQRTPMTIAVSGVISNTETEYDGLPVINALTDIERLVNLIEEITPDRLPNYNRECCTACGCDCRQMAEKILRGDASPEDCVRFNRKISVKIDGEELPMVPFVQSMVKSVTTALLKELDGYEEGRHVDIHIE